MSASGKEISLDEVVSESLTVQVLFGLRSYMTSNKVGHEAPAWNSKCRGPEEEWTCLILPGVRVRRGSNLGQRPCPALALSKNNLGPGAKSALGSSFLHTPALLKRL